MEKLLRKESRPKATVRLQKGFEDFAKITLVETARTPRGVSELQNSIGLHRQPKKRPKKGGGKGSVVLLKNVQKWVVLCCSQRCAETLGNSEVHTTLGIQALFSIYEVCVFTPHEAGCDSAHQSSRVESGSKIGGQVSRREIKTRAMRPRRRVETGHKYL